MFTRTITDDHGRHGGLYHHTDKRGCTRTMRRIIFSHGRLRMTTENFWIILLVFLNRISVDIRDNPCEKQYRIIPWMFMECHGGLLYIYGTRARASHTCIHNTMRVITRKDMRQSSTLHHAARKNPQVLAAPCYLLLSLQKFFLKKNLHFLHQEKKRSVKSGYFGWRIGCRILLPYDLSYTISPVFAELRPHFAWNGAGWGRKVRGYDVTKK